MMSGDYQGRNNKRGKSFDPEALAVSNLRLAYAMAKKCSPLYLRDDAAQEAAIKLLQVSQYYSPEKGSFSTYACTCMGRRIMDFAKVEKRLAGHFESFDQFEDDHQNSPLDERIESERLLFVEQLNKAVQSLPLYERHVITFRFGLYESEPHTLVEIGAMLKMPKNKVRGIQLRAFKKLKDILNEK